ncbi:uncharacterized protein LOC121386626 [Gigantopelta aegis]|uniref:uncharacterized protein LOC121386626 n=1 Tax=Gigantopelta aegis TaxID=1735272 RepID=UPI001B8892B0|nr:uncharacterized protein LOC121386626 [Gigantopelta aegis]
MGKGHHKESVPEVEEKTQMAPPQRRRVHSPPDGGWGWMIVFSSFVIHVIADGIVYSFGVFFVEFLDYFGGGKGETAWVGSLVPAVTYTVGPIASALTNRYGCRVISIVGSLVAGVGFMLSLFAPNIYYLYISFGIMAGFGFGLIYLPAIVSVANYFEKRRSFATGLAVCGSGFGTFIFAPLTKWLLDEYGWKGTILIEAGLVLNIIVCGALFRPLQTRLQIEEPTESKMNRLKKNSDIFNANFSNGTVNFERNENGEAMQLKEEQEELLPHDLQVNGIVHDMSIIRSLEMFVQPQGTAADIVRMCASNRELKPNALEQDAKASAGSEGQDLELSPASLACSDGALHHVKSTALRPRLVLPSNHHHRRLSSHTGPMYRKDIFYRASLQTIPMFRSHPDVYIASVTSIPDESSESSVEWSTCACLKPSREFRDTFNQMLQFSLLKDGVFLMFVISNFLTSIGFNMPFIYLPDRAIQSGVEKNDAAFLLSVVGIANTFGRVLFGWLSDRSGVNRLMLYSCSLTICGIGTALSPFCGGSYPLLVGYAALFGIFIGVYVSLTSVVLVDLLGLDRLTNSFGLVLLFQGGATFIGPPLAGWMYDWTGSYDISFHVMGAMVALSGIMLYFIPLVEWYRKRKKLLSGQMSTYEFEIRVPEMRKGTTSA